MHLCTKKWPVSSASIAETSYFEYLLSLNRLSRRASKSRARAPDAGEVRRVLETILAQMKSEAQSRGGAIKEAHGLVEAALYIFVDELLLRRRPGESSDWSEFRSRWEEHGLTMGQERLHDASGVFWKRFERLLRDDDVASRQAIEILYIMVGLGYRGELRNRFGELKATMKRARRLQLTSVTKGEKDSLCHEAYQEVDREEIEEETSPSVIVSGFLFLGVLSLATVLASFVFHYYTRETTDIIETLADDAGSVAALSVWLGPPLVQATVVTVVALLLIALFVGSRKFVTSLRRRNFRESVTEWLASVDLHSAKSPKEATRIKEQFIDGISKYRGENDTTLYEQPWFLLVGDSGAGKTEAIRNSGINLDSYLNNLDQGEGGTLFFDWWFAAEGVIIDLAGGLFKGDGWGTLLNHLARQRRSRPVNGVILALPATPPPVDRHGASSAGARSMFKGLLAESTEEAKARALEFKKQLDTLHSRIDVRFPIWVIITLSDRILGFREFFRTMISGREKNQIIGWSFSGALETPYDHERFEAGARQLIEALERHRLRLLNEAALRTASSPTPTDEVDTLFGFPERVAEMLPNIHTYLSTICDKESEASPFLRGVYLTSAMEKGSELDLGLGGKPGETVVEDPLDRQSDNKRALFIQHLLQRKVFPEKGLVTPSANADRRRAQLKWMTRVMYATGLTLVLSIVVYTGLGLHGWWKQSVEDWRYLHAAALRDAGRAGDARRPEWLITRLDDDGVPRWNEDLAQRLIRLHASVEQPAAAESGLVGLIPDWLKTDLEESTRDRAPTAYVNGFAICVIEPIVHDALHRLDERMDHPWDDDRRAGEADETHSAQREAIATLVGWVLLANRKEDGTAPTVGDLLRLARVIETRPQELSDPLLTFLRGLADDETLSEADPISSVFPQGRPADDLGWLERAFGVDLGIPDYAHAEDLEGVIEDLLDDSDPSRLDDLMDTATDLRQVADGEAALISAFEERPDPPSPTAVAKWLGRAREAEAQILSALEDVVGSFERVRALCRSVEPSSEERETTAALQRLRSGEAALAEAEALIDRLAALGEDNGQDGLADLAKLKGRLAEELEKYKQDLNNKVAPEFVWARDYSTVLVHLIVVADGSPLTAEEIWKRSPLQEVTPGFDIPPIDKNALQDAQPRLDALDKDYAKRRRLLDGWSEPVGEAMVSDVLIPALDLLHQHTRGLVLTAATEWVPEEGVGRTLELDDLKQLANSYEKLGTTLAESNLLSDIDAIQERYKALTERLAGVAQDVQASWVERLSAFKPEPEQTPGALASAFDPDRILARAEQLREDLARAKDVVERLGKAESRGWTAGEIPPPRSAGSSPLDAIESFVDETGLSAPPASSRTLVSALEWLAGGSRERFQLPAAWGDYSLEDLYAMRFLEELRVSLVAKAEGPIKRRWSTFRAQCGGRFPFDRSSGAYVKVEELRGNWEGADRDFGPPLESLVSLASRQPEGSCVAPPSLAAGAIDKQFQQACADLDKGIRSLGDLTPSDLSELDFKDLEEFIEVLIDSQATRFWLSAEYERGALMTHIAVVEGPPKDVDYEPLPTRAGQGFERVGPFGPDDRVRVWVGRHFDKWVEQKVDLGIADRWLGLRLINRSDAQATEAKKWRIKIPVRPEGRADGLSWKLKLVVELAKSVPSPDQWPQISAE